MTAHVAASDHGSRPLPDRGKRTGRLSRSPSLAGTVVAGVVIAALTFVPAPASATEAAASSELEYARGSDVYLVSRTDLGESADPAITPDGQRVAFVSTARDLAEGRGTGIPNVFLATASTRSSDPFSGAPLLVSRPDRSLPQVPADGPSGEPAVSADGRYVAFTSAATNLVPGGPVATAAGVYVHDTVDGTTVRVDQGTEAGAASWRPDISDDGRYVVFESDEDAFVADLDADDDGVRGDVAVTRVVAGTEAGGLSEPAISGDGQWIVVTAPVAAGPAGAADPVTELIRVHRQTGEHDRVLADARTGAVDATGQVVAGVATECSGSPTVVVAALDPQEQWNAVAVGTEYGIADHTGPVVSADGSRVAFVGASGDAGEPADAAIVRIAAPRWTESSPAGTSCPPEAADVTAVGPGESASLSASGRTVAVAGPGDMSVAARSVVAVDLHTHDGLAVSNTMRTGAVARYVTAADIADVDRAALRAEAGELARLELGRLQDPPTGAGPKLGDLPLDRLALGATVLAELPLQLAAYPGGWHDLLPDTPFADDVAENVTLHAIVEWADESASGEHASAAAAVRGIRLGDVSRLGTPAGDLSPASLLLGAVPLAELAIGGSGDPLAAWRSEVRAQGIELDVTDDTVLAEADAAGLDLGSIGLEDISVADLPASSTTPVTGTTVGEELFSLVTPGDYPWQAFDPAALPADVPTEVSAADDCAGAACDGTARFRFTFDSGPGETTRFTDAVASVRLPASTAAASIVVGESGPLAVTAELPYEGTVRVDGPLVQLPLGDGIAGTTRSVAIGYTASRGLGEWVTSATLTAEDLVARDAIEPDESTTDAAADAEDGDVPVAPASAPALAESAVRYGVVEAAAGSEGWYRIAPPAAGERLEISAGSADRGLTLTLLEPSVDTTPLGVAARRDAPTRALPGEPGLAIGAGFGTPVAGYDVVDVARSDAGGSATVDARWTEVDGDDPWLIRVTASADSAEAGFYGIHSIRSAEDPLPRCTPWIAPPSPEPDDGSGSLSPVDPFGPLTPVDPNDPYRYVGPYGPYDDIDPYGFVDPLDPDVEVEAPAPPTSDAVTAASNTVFVTDFGRMRDLYGAEDVDEVLTSIRALDGVGAVGEGSVKGAVLTVDGDPRVVAARAALDADPCSVTARQKLVREINRYVAAAIGSHRDSIAAVVIVGGDDVIPHAPLAQRSDAVVEEGHAGALRLAGTTSAPCTAVAAGAIDPCATPQSAAAAGGFLLSDDPYALADAYPSQGGHLYVPTVAVGRLIDTPDQIRAQLDRFRSAEGVLEADSLLAAGYGPWSELPEALSAELSWRTGGGDVVLESGWTTRDAEAALTPDDGGDPPGIIALNGVGDERRLVSGAAVADDAAEDDAALEAGDHRPAPPPAADATVDPTDPPEEFEGALVLSPACHSGVHLPESVYGDEPHWASTFTAAGAFIGSTGCGLADETALGPSERLLALYAGWIGVGGENGPVSAGSALAFAKQSYLAAAVQYGESDAQALEQTIFYGVPLYTFRDSTNEPPLAESVADDATTLRLAPGLATVTLTDTAGTQKVFLTAEGQEPLSVAGQALLPVVTRTVPSTDGARDVARGVLVTGLSSEWREPVEPAVADPGARIARSESGATAPPSAAALATLTRQLGPDGPAAVVVAVAARLSADPSGASRFEVYPDMEIEVLYGDESDDVAPVITTTAAGATFRAVAADPSASGEVVRALLLVAPADSDDGPMTWQAIDLQSADGDWSADVPSEVGADYRWVLQVVDDAGNVTTAHSDAR